MPVAGGLGRQVTSAGRVIERERADSVMQARLPMTMRSPTSASVTRLSLSQTACGSAAGVEEHAHRQRVAAQHFVGLHRVGDGLSFRWAR